MAERRGGSRQIEHSRPPSRNDRFPSSVLRYVGGIIKERFQVYPYLVSTRGRASCYQQGITRASKDILPDSSRALGPATVHRQDVKDAAMPLSYYQGTTLDISTNTTAGPQDAAVLRAVAQSRAFHSSSSATARKYVVACSEASRDCQCSTTWDYAATTTSTSTFVPKHGSRSML